MSAIKLCDMLDESRKKADSTPYTKHCGQNYADEWSLVLRDSSGITICEAGIYPQQGDDSNFDFLMLSANHIEKLTAALRIASGFIEHCAEGFGYEAECAEKIREEINALCKEEK